jgi:hypothetical protein
MSLFSSTGFFGKIWAAIKGAVTKVQVTLLPEAIIITEAVNNALKSGLVDDVVAAISPSLKGIPSALLSAAQSLIPKVLASELGLEALGASATPAAAAAWAQSVITAFAGLNSNLVAESKIWTNLAASLVILFDQGKTTNTTWIQWANTADEAFKEIQAAAAAASAAVKPSTAPAAAATTTA